MAPIVVRYPLDITGENPNNLVVNEEHTLGNRAIRAFPTSYGGFFTESVVVKEKSTQRILEKNVDYYCSQIYDIPSARYGKEICSVIVVKNQAVDSNVQVTYQALGGPWSTSQQAIVNMFNSLGVDDRPVKWGDILNKPTGFNPAPHLHDVGDVYGFEYIVAELERIRQAILVGDSISHDEIYKYIDALIDSIESSVDSSIDTLTQNLNDHINNKSNPHEVTPEQLGVYTKDQTNTMVNGVRTDLTSSIQNVENTLNQSIIQHTSDKNNPHSVTAEQVGAYDKTYMDQQLSGIDNRFNDLNDRVVINATPATPINLRIVSGRLEAQIGGTWQVVWPPRWQ